MFIFMNDLYYRDCVKRALTEHINLQKLNIYVSHDCTGMFSSNNIVNNTNTCIYIYIYNYQTHKLFLFVILQ